MTLKDLDYLSPKISLFYYGKHRHSANFGAILTILMIFFCFIYIFYLFFEVYLYTSSTIQYYRHFFTDPYSYLFNNHNGIFLFSKYIIPKIIVMYLLLILNILEYFYQIFKKNIKQILKYYQ